MGRFLVAALAAAAGAAPAAAAPQSKDPSVEALKRQVEAQQAQIDAQARAIAELRAILGKDSQTPVSSMVAAGAPAAKAEVPVAESEQPSQPSAPAGVVRLAGADISLSGTLQLNTLVSDMGTWA